MSTTRNQTLDEQRRKQAADWLIELQSREDSELSAEMWSRWEQWISVTENRAVFDRIAALWQESGRIERPTMPTAAELASVSEDLPTLREARTVYWRSLGNTTRMAASLAAVILILGSVMWWAKSERAGGSSVPSVQETARDEQRDVRLADGTSVTLGPQSAITVAFRANRRVVIFNYGEALFDVAHDPSRPFTVVAGKSAITALGTAFNVLRSNDRMVVTVIQGTVEVTPHSAAASARLARGEEISYDTRDERSTIKQVDPEIATSWRSGRLRYLREPLRHVIDDLNRYSNRQIVLAPGVAELEFTGTVFRDQIPEWTRGLERIFPVTLEEETAQQATIRMRR